MELGTKQVCYVQGNKDTCHVNGKADRCNLMGKDEWCRVRRICHVKDWKSWVRRTHVMHKKRKMHAI